MANIRGLLCRLSVFLPAVLSLAVDSAWAATPKRSETLLEQKEFFRPELALASSHASLDDVLDQLPNRAAWESFLRANGARPEAQRVRVFIDPRSGVASNVLGPFPLIPGRGVGNDVALADLSRAAGRVLKQVDSLAVGEAVRRFVHDHRAILAVDTRQLGAVNATQVTPELWQVSIPQVYRGIPVRDGRVVATIVQGNLVMIGAENWGNVALDVSPLIGADDALHQGFLHADGRHPGDRLLREPALEIVPAAAGATQEGEAYRDAVGKGYDHRLVWTFAFQRPPENARWEVMVDAQAGDVVAFQDLNQYVERQIIGGVYPLTNTGVCPDAARCGTMQLGWPMPFADTGFAGVTTNSGGIYNYTSGTATTTLTGPFVDINDTCGAISVSSGTGDINMGGANNQHDCTSGGGSAGNTPASRSAFYEVNKIAELARGWLPTNAWLQSQLDVNVNINLTCNAFWNGSTINFYRSGGGCRNTGEIAAIFDHEWGHGLDDFDAGGQLSNSSEAYADVAAIYRLNASCVGYGFFQTLNDGCGQTADGTGFNSNEAQQGAAHCDLDCSGVRDADYLKHSPNTPDTALGFVCTSCLTGPGPCGRQVHCAAAPVRQAAWDLVKRDLAAAPFNYDTQTALLVGNKLFYHGSGNIGAWHACTCGGTSSGCGASNGYMQWLAADDDNGNVNDGTPHMTAIFAAYNRHGIACSTPVATNSGCSGQPNGGSGPTLSATPGNYSAALSWNSVGGATRYWVMRTEGHAGAEFGKTKIAEVTGLSYTDAQVANGRSYWYNIVAQGSSSSCYSRVSNAVQVVPTAPVNPDFSVSCSPASLTVTQGGPAATSTCTITSINGFSAAVNLSCTGMPAGSTCSFNPASVTPPPNGTANSTLSVTAAANAATGTFNFNVQGVSGSLIHTFGMSLTVNPAGGGGAQNAVFDTALQAPKCGTVGISCDSGTLVNSRDTLSPSETNQPNTINDSCADGTSGTYHVDESNDRVKVLTTDGTNFAPGKTVRIEATVWAWTTPSQDHLDLYYTANANSPSWTFIATLTPTVAGAQVLSATYTLPSGPLQAVRARFRYQGSAASCGTGSYNDHDDLVFAVSSPQQTVVFSDDFETNKGWTTNPNGTDTATTGQWERGDPEPTNSGGPKQLGTTVSGVNDLVTGRLAGISSGAFDIDGGVTSIQSPPITLPGTGTLTLSFSYYLAHGSNSSSADFLRVKIVGSTTVQVLEELGAANNDDGAWITGTASLNAFAGQTVRILIEAADASTASLVEAAVDDVLVTQQ
jgi:Zn-dependent metalloprotease